MISYCRKCFKDHARDVDCLVHYCEMFERVPMSKESWFGFKVGVLFNASAFWVGAHYSPFNRRLCVNLVPFVTIWIALPGGKCPHKEKM